MRLSPTGVRADWICDEEALAELVPAWSALWAGTPGASPFQAPAWQMAWWRAFRPGRPRVLALRAGEQLAGVLPLYEDAGTLRLFGAGTTDRQDALLPADLLGDAAAALSGLEGEAIDLFDVAEGSPLLALGPPGWAGDTVPHDVCPVLDLTRPLPAAAERNLRHARARAGRMGGLSTEPATADTLPGLLDALFALHAARWRERDQPGVLSDVQVQAWHREAAPGLLAAGALRLTAFRLGGRLAAVQYGFLRDGRATFYIGGFDPAFAYANPGTLAVGHAIDEARREGAAAFDFLRGREAYKYRWGAVDQPTWRRRMVHL